MDHAISKELSKCTDLSFLKDASKCTDMLGLNDYQMPSDMSFVQDFIDNLPPMEEISEVIPSEEILLGLALGGGILDWSSRFDTFMSNDKREEHVKTSQAVGLLGNAITGIAVAGIIIKRVYSPNKEDSHKDHHE
jgi:hypothetical protein